MADTLSREQMLQELHSWATGFIRESADWRKNSWENQWRNWQRNADCVYPTEIAAKKESWQSRAVWPITASHLENAVAQLFRTEVGPRPPLEFKGRIESPQPQIPGMPPPINQGELIRDLVLWEREKASYETERNKQVIDKATYGSGFMRVRFETKSDDRKVKVPIYEEPSVFDPGSVLRAMSGQLQIIGQKDEIQPTITYRGIRCEHLSIWDVFPDPKALQIKGHPIAVRYETTYGEILKGVEEGYYLPECLSLLRDSKSEETTPEDKKVVETDRQIADSNVNRPDYGRKFKCYEIEAKLPKKWVLINDEPIDDPEKLMSVVIRVHDSCVFYVAPSESYDGEPSVYKDDYFTVTGQFYGRGIPEMLKDVQLVSSETINQRLDGISQTLRERYAIIENAVIDPKDLEENKSYIRMKSPSDINDVRQLISRLDQGGIKREAFVEPQEWERIAQERTSITRATLGTANQVRDSNRTLGGQQIQQGVTGDKLAYIGMVSEFSFQKDIAHGIWALIYSNYNPEDYMMALGPEKASQLIVMTPEQVALNYRLIPKGVFETENKALRQARIQSITDRYGMLPWFNILGAAKAEISSIDEDETTFILPEAEAAQIMAKAEQIGMGMAENVIAQQSAEAEAKEAPSDRG